jgi:iron complex transport system substrate-binding protein
VHRSLTLFVVGLALFTGACGTAAGDTSFASASEVTTTSGEITTTLVPTTTEASATATLAADDFPVTAIGDNGEVVVPAMPEAIVSLSPTATEILFGIGAGGRVVAVDSLSDHPAEAPTTSLNAFEPNVEAIAEFGPDLVVLSFDPGDVVASLEALGIPTLVQSAAASIDDSYEQMRRLGAATGAGAGAESAIANMQEAIDGIVASIPPVDEPVRYYHELDNTYYSAASSTFIGEVYGLLGMVSIADGAADLNFGYPQLSGEFILEADPDIILLADTKCCDQDAAAVAARAGWEQLTAVRRGAIVELDDNIASRWGPRIVDLLAEVSAALIEMGEG